MPWFRTSTYTTDDRTSDEDVDVTLFGVTFKPNSDVSIKFETGEEGGSDVMRMGVGYMF